MNKIHPKPPLHPPPPPSPPPSTLPSNELSSATPFNQEFHIIFGPSVFKGLSKIQEDKTLEFFKASLKPGGQIFTEFEVPPLSKSSDFEKKEHDSFIYYQLK